MENFPSSKKGYESGKADNPQTATQQEAEAARYKQPLRYMFQLPTIYGKPYNHGTIYYRDKDCNRFIADDPWHRHRTNKRIILNGAYFNLIVLK